MGNEKTILVETFGSAPVIRIIDFLIDNPLSDYSKEEMIKGIGISKVTFYKYFPLLEESGIVRETRKIGKSKMYKLNEKNDVVKKLKELVWALGMKAMQRSVEGIEIKIVGKTK